MNDTTQDQVYTGEELLHPFRSLDLSTNEGLEAMLGIVENGDSSCSYSDIRVMDEISKGDTALSDVLNLLQDPLEISHKLADICQKPKDIENRLVINAHHFCSVGTEGIRRWFGTDATYESIIDNATDANSDLFLAVMGSSADLASQALNRYDTGIFLWANEYSKRADLDDRGIPTIYPELGKLVEMNERFFVLWHRVFVKYLSHLINTPDFAIKTESATDLKELCTSVVSPWEDSELGRITNFEIKDLKLAREYMATNPEKYAPRIEVAARITSEKIQQFYGILEQYDLRLEYARPKVPSETTQTI